MQWVGARAFALAFPFITVCYNGCDMFPSVRGLDSPGSKDRLNSGSALPIFIFCRYRVASKVSVKGCKLTSYLLSAAILMFSIDIYFLMWIDSVGNLPGPGDC